MITDEQTNKVYFSEHLKAYKCWENIKLALEEHHVPYGLLPGTKDIWVRDFMPLQKGKTSFLGYKYDPDYLQDEQEYITRNVRDCYDFSGTYLTVADAIIDGGNMIKCGDNIIMTDKLFIENDDKDREAVKEYLEELLGNELVIIPWDKEEKCGHSDGMVRYVEPGHVVINNYADIDEPLRRKILKALEPHFEKISELHYGNDARKYSWAHINFLRVGNTIFVPQMGIASDTKATEQLSEIYRGCDIVPVEVEGVVKKGGALNCVSWNILEQDKPMFRNLNERYSHLMSEYIKHIGEFNGGIEDLFIAATQAREVWTCESMPSDVIELPDFMDLTFDFLGYVKKHKEVSVKALFPKDACIGLPYNLPYRFTSRKR